MRSIRGQVQLYVIITGLFAMALVQGCASDSYDEFYPDGDGDIDGDGDGDGDSDGDGDGDGDTDVDGDGDGDGDGDIDGDTDTDIDGDGDTDIEAGCDPEDPDACPDGQMCECTDDVCSCIEDPECDTENEVVLYLSADDSNSMAGPVLARQQIRSHALVSGPIRIYEFLNYYSFDYEAAEAGSVRVSAQMRPTDDSDERFDLQIGVRAQDVAEEDRRPLNITLSLDTSGSMSGDPITLVRESCLALTSALREGDVVSMVTWSTTQNILLDSHVITDYDDPVLVQHCEQLSANGGTDLHSGLVTAYDLARRNFNANRINRVILMSDGGANVGVTDAELIAENADDAEGEAIYMMGVGMGSPSSYNDTLMDTITDAGKGAYIYIDSREEAWLMLGERLLTNAEVAARDVQVELTMPPTFRMDEFHGEEYSENPEEVEPQHLAPNDAMIFHQIIASCDPSTLDMGDTVTVTASFETPFTREAQAVTEEMTLGMLMTGDNSRLVKGNAIVAYAQALENRSLLEEALTEVQDAIETLGDDPDLLEIEELLVALNSR